MALMAHHTAEMLETDCLPARASFSFLHVRFPALEPCPTSSHELAEGERFAVK